jgi:amidase
MVSRLRGLVRRPSTDVLRRIAGQLGFEVTETEAAEFQAVVSGFMQMCDEIDEMNDGIFAWDPPLHGRRDSGRVPLAQEDPFNAFIRVCRITGSEAGALRGRRLAVKDSIAVAGLPTTNGGRRLPYHVPTEDAVAVERVLAEGAVIVGKTNLEDMAFGWGEGSAFGPTLNPRDLRLTTGGSSSGSAAAVAGGLADMALGGDSAGSIRVPASWCGIVGLKPTQGLVPTLGLSHFDYTMETIGPMTTTVGDNALLLEVIAGPDWREPSGMSSYSPIPYADAATENLAGLRIGVVSQALEPAGCDDDTLDSFAAAVERLRDRGAEIVSVESRSWLASPTIAFGLTLFVVCANHHLFGDGYGHLSRVDTQAVASRAAQTRLNGNDVPVQVQAALLAGEYLQQSYQGIHHAKAVNARIQMRRELCELLDEVDVLVTPTVTEGPFELPEGPLSDSEFISRLMGFTAGVNVFPPSLTGHPALSMPCGVDSRDRPIGFQIIAGHYCEAALYRVAFGLEAEIGAFPVSDRTPSPSAASPVVS